MELYDPSKVGARIAHGRSHSVYHYGSDEVIRFPRAEKWIWGSNMVSRFEHDIAACKKYLGEYVLDTRVVQDPASGNVATIQPCITGHYLSKADLADPYIKKQFDDFLERHEAMTRDGYGPVDLIGQGGVLRRRLSNIMVLPDKRIRLFDAVTADLSDIQRGISVARLVKNLVLRRQESTIRYFRS